MGESRSPALFVSSRDTRLSVDRLYQIVGGLAQAAGIDRAVSPHKIRHSSITALLDLNGGDVRSAQAHSRHKNLATLIRYDDGRQQLQGKAAKTLADAISERDVDRGQMSICTETKEHSLTHELRFTAQKVRFSPS